jgi:hypothetical protein
MKIFFKAGFSSGTRLRRAASGYDARKEKMSLTGHPLELTLLLFYHRIHTLIW